MWILQLSITVIAFLGTGALVAIGVRWLIQIWKGVAKKESASRIPENMGLELWLKTIGVVALVVVLVSGVWAVRFMIASSGSATPNEVREEATRKLLSTPTPTQAELDAAKRELEDKRDKMPHEDALTDFEEYIKKQNEQIDKRNQSQTRRSR